MPKVCLKQQHLKQQPLPATAGTAGSAKSTRAPVDRARTALLLQGTRELQGGFRQQTLYHVCECREEAS